MIRRFRSFLGSQPPVRTEAPATPVEDAPHPDRPVYVVGDVHGRADLLERILERIDEHVGASAAADPQLVFLGDYIDRGPDSARVITRLRELEFDFPANVTCLLGNHERMMLDFLEDPISRGSRWLRSGARETLESFGLHTSDLDLGAPADSYAALGAALRSHLPNGLVDWLRSRPLSWSSGTLWAVHAAADPHHRMEDQSARVLLWGHPEFPSRQRNDGLWVVHGHTAMDRPVVGDGRICVDTGAWETGHLTACAITPRGKISFLTT